MEIIRKSFQPANTSLKAIIFDFDGTLSTIRSGWQKIMEDMMIDFLERSKRDESENMVELVKEYIDESTGLQTCYQMEWLVNQLTLGTNKNNIVTDPWWYKDEYNNRLKVTIEEIYKYISLNDVNYEEYLIKGSVNFLSALKNNYIELYLASGTDDVDVIKELKLLKIDKYFTKIQGAIYHKKRCPKELMLTYLVEEKKINPSEIAILGDGKVEIEIGNRYGVTTIGVASDEILRCGINCSKRKKLISAGANAIIGDYCDLDNIICFLLNKS